MKKFFLSLLVIMVAVVAVLVLTKDTLIKVGVEKGVEAVTGLRLSVHKFSVGLIKTNVDIAQLKLYNPRGFKDKVMLDMPEIYVDYDLVAIIRGKIHLPEMRIDMKEFMVVKNEKGELNLDSLKAVKEEGAPAKPAEKKPAAKGKAPEIQIDKLQLKIGKVIYKDYSKGGEPQVQEFDINLNEQYSNINDPNKLVSLIVVKALMNTSVSKLADFDMSGLEGNVADTLMTTQKIAAGAVAGLGAAVGAASSGSGSDTVQATTETIKKTAEDLKNAFFGSKEEEQ